MALIQITCLYGTVNSIKVSLERSHERESIDDKPNHPDLRVKHKVGHQVSIVMTTINSFLLDVGIVVIKRLLNHRIRSGFTDGWIYHRIIKIETNGTKEDGGRLLIHNRV